MAGVPSRDQLDTGAFRASDRLAAIQTVTTAALRDAGLLGDSPVRWKVGRPIQRDWSVVVPLRARTRGDTVSLYVKQSRLSPVDDTVSASERADRQAAALATEATIGSREFATLEGAGVPVDRWFYLDPDTGTGVRLAVPGQPLRQWLAWSITRSRGQIETVGRALGRATAAIEVTAPGASSVDTDQAQWALEQRLDRRRARMSLDDAALAQRAISAWSQHAACEVSYGYAHGDVSATNVLVRRGHVGLIDASWQPEPRGFDIVDLCHRLELQARRRSFLRRPVTLVTRAATDAYVSGSSERANQLAFATLHYHVRGLATGNPVSRARVRAVLDASPAPLGAGAAISSQPSP